MYTNANDWKCGNCSWDNWARRTECKNCGKRRPKAAAPKRPGDWDCTDCGKNNFASRNECFGCNRKRKKTDNGDWVCPNCSDFQFGRNRRCRKCDTPKPAAKECVVCGDSTNAGLECKSFHFACDDCLNGDLVANGTDRVDKDGVVSCMYPDCGDTYCSNTIACHVDVGQLLQIAGQHKEREIAASMETRLQDQMKQGVDQMIANNHYDHITNKILSLSCPRCSAVYVDFVRCCALKCSNKTCGAAFCAWCLADCGYDAHSHVASCKHKPYGADTFFARASEVNTAMDKLKQTKFTAYWAAVDDKSKSLLESRLKGLVDIRW